LGGDKEEKKKEEEKEEEGQLPTLGMPLPHSDGIELGGDKKEKKREEEKEEGQLPAPEMPSLHPDGSTPGRDKEGEVEEEEEKEHLPTLTESSRLAEERRPCPSPSPGKPSSLVFRVMRWVQERVRQWLSALWACF
jgi:hypothetical protein